MRPQLVQQVFAFVQWQADDVSVAAAAQVQRVAAGRRVSADQRVDGARRFARIAEILEAFAQLARAVAARIVAALQRNDRAFEIHRQGVIRLVHIGKAGIAAGGRHFDCVEQAADGSEVVVRHVGVPLGFVMAEITNRFAVDLDIRHHGDFRKRIHDVLAGVYRRLVQFAEAAGEIEKARVVEMLAAKPQDEMLVPGIFDLLESRLVHGLGQVDSRNIGAQAGAGRFDRDAGCRG